MNLFSQSFDLSVIYCLIKIISNKRYFPFCKKMSSLDGESDIFLPDYFWSYTMLKHYKTGCYVGCDYTGKVTLVENSEPEYPKAEILFIANVPSVSWWSLWRSDLHSRRMVGVPSEVSSLFDQFDPPVKHKPINMFSVANMYLININQETAVHVHLLW